MFVKEFPLNFFQILIASKKSGLYIYIYIYIYIIVTQRSPVRIRLSPNFSCSLKKYLPKVRWHCILSYWWWSISRVSRSRVSRSRVSKSRIIILFRVKSPDFCIPTTAFTFFGRLSSPSFFLYFRNSALLFSFLFSFFSLFFIGGNCCSNFLLGILVVLGAGATGRKKELNFCACSNDSFLPSSKIFPQSI